MEKLSTPGNNRALWYGVERDTLIGQSKKESHKMFEQMLRQLSGLFLCFKEKTDATFIYLNVIISPKYLLVGISALGK